MPFVEPNPALMRAPEGVAPQQSTTTADSTIAAAFRQDNTVVNFFRNTFAQSFPPEPDYNPLNDIRDTKYLFDHGDSFLSSRSRAETRSIMRKIDHEDEDRQILAASGVGGFVAQIAAGTLDPTLAMPGGVLVRGIKGGYSVSRTALSTGLAAGAQNALQEGFLQTAQETRTAGESAVSIGSAMLLGALIGTGAASLLTRTERRVLERSLDADRAAMDAHATGEPLRSMGAAATGDVTGKVPPDAILEGTNYRLPIRNAAGTEVGGVKFDFYDATATEPGVIKIIGSGIEDAANRGKGYAVDAYQKLADHALATGRELWSDQSVSPAAARVYDALEKRGYKVERIPADQVESIYDPAFKVTAGPEKAQSRTDLLVKSSAWSELDSRIKIGVDAYRRDPADINNVGDMITQARMIARARDVFEMKAGRALDAEDAIARDVGEAAQTLRTELYDKFRNAPDTVTDADRARLQELTDRIGKGLEQLTEARVQMGEELARTQAPTGGGTGGSVGAAATDTRQLEMFPSIPGTSFMAVTRRVMNAAAVTARRTMADLAELPYRFKENEVGVATSQGPSVERLARMEMNGTRVAISDELLRQFSDYRYGEPDKMAPALRARIEDFTGRGDGKMSYHDFKQEVSVALQSEDRHAIPQVSNAAVYIRSKLLDKWGDRAETAIEGFEKNIPKDGESYFPHVWNKEMVRARRPEFVNRLVDLYQTDQVAKRATQERLGWMNAQLQSWQDQIGKLEARFGRAEERAKQLDARAAERSRDDMPKTPGMNEPDATGRTAELQVRKAILQAEAKDLADAADLIEELVRQNPQLERPLQRTIAAMEAKGRKIDIVSAKHGEAGRGAKRSEKRLANLEDQLSRTEERQQLIEDYLVVANQMHDEVRTKIEGELGAWNGKSASEAKAALKAREQYATQTGRTADQPRLKSADDAVDKTVKRILANDYERPVDELRDRAQQTTDRILNSPDGRLPYDEHLGGPRIGVSDGSPPPRGSLAARTLDVSNAWAREWIENDIEHVVAMHLRTMVPDVLLAERFGDVEMSDAFRRIHESYANIIDGTKAEKERTRLGKERDAAIRDVAAVRDRVRGIYGWNPNLRNMARIANGAKAVNNLTSMGVAAVSSLPDAAGTLIRYGMQTGLQDGWSPFIRSMMNPETSAAWGKFKSEMRAIGIGVETAINSRQHSLDDISDVYRPQSRVERTLQAASDKFFVANLLAPETDMFKLISAHVSVSNILKATKAAAEGKATAKQIGNLAESSIDQNMAGRIWQQFLGNGGEVRNGVHIPNTKDWLDQAAADALNGAVARDVDIMVVTPGQEKPLWMSQPVISLLGQFKAFTASSTERIVIANLQRRDAAALSGLVTSLGLGIMSYKLNSFFGGQKTSDRPQDWVKEGISRAGLLGWFEEGNALASKASRGSVDIYRMIGADKPLSRFASRSAADMMLGPTWGKLEALPKITGSAFGGDWSAADTTAVRRLIAGQNLFYVRGLFNQVEQSINSRFGVPERKEPQTRH